VDVRAAAWILCCSEVWRSGTDGVARIEDHC
jgi:hypothetical protein